MKAFLRKKAHTHTHTHTHTTLGYVNMFKKDKKDKVRSIEFVLFPYLLTWSKFSTLIKSYHGKL